MGSFKIKNLFISSLLFAGLNTSALTFQEYQQQKNNQYKTYKDNFEKEFKAYKKAYDEAFKEFKKDLKLKWPEKKPIISTKHKWVQYSPNLNSRKSIDFDKLEIDFEVIAKSEKEAKEKISKMFNNLSKDDVKTAYKKDILENKVQKKLHKPKKVIKSNQKIIADIINRQEMLRLKGKLNKKKIVVEKYKDKFIYKTNIKLPANSMMKKAEKLKPTVLVNSGKQKLPPALVYAIIHSESSFNPMARSGIPAFGLMQIVPKSAGIDAYQYLYNKKRVLTASYLYNSDKNINIGSGYLHILYYRYLRKIKNPQSKIYCTIAAYNTGAGNVAKAFIGSTNISKASIKINNMSSGEVYNKLLKDLPYDETKNYLKKVTKRISSYKKFLSKK